MGGPGGRLVRGVLDDPPTRVVAVTVTGVAREVLRRHGAEGGAALELAGRGAAATALLAAYIKEPERILVELALEEPPGTWSGMADASGRLRGRVDVPPGPPPVRWRGVFVVRTWHDQRTVHEGRAELDHPSLEAGLQAWLDASQQSPSAVRVGAERAEGDLAWAGGVLAERLPVEGAPGREAWNRSLRSRLQGPVREVVGAFQAGTVPGFEVLEERPLLFRCDCSLERVEAMLRALGPDELRALAEEPGRAEVTCHFCATRRVVARDRLLALAGED